MRLWLVSTRTNHAGANVGALINGHNRFMVEVSNNPSIVFRQADRRFSMIVSALSRKADPSQGSDRS